MTRARDVSRLITTPPSIYATDSEASSGFLSLSSASTIYKGSPNRNLIINGDMQIAQRGTSVASITSSGYRTVDRFKFEPSSMGTWTVSQENDAPTGSGFRKSTKVLVTTADASPAAGDYIQFYQAIEGQNVQQIAKGTSSAKQLTLSFWVKANVTGTYIVDLYDNDNTRVVSGSYSISASATWEKKTVTFAADTTGAFDNDNAASLYIEWWLGAGSTYTSGTLNTSWASVTNANRAVGQTNLASATSNYWQITGVQLEVGDTATPFEFKPFDEELRKCKRYYQKSFPLEVTPASSYTSTKLELQGARHQVADVVGFRSQTLFFPEMRVTPTLTFYNGSTDSTTTLRLFSNNNQTQDLSGHGAYAPDTKSFYISYYTGVTVGTSGLSCMVLFNYTASSEL
jgi:hypothetical protein